MDQRPIYTVLGDVVKIDLLSQSEITAVEYRDLELSLNQILIKNEQATFIGRASGRSMEGVGIFDGDLLLIDRSVNYKQKDVVVVDFNGAFVCKILDVSYRLLISA